LGVRTKFQTFQTSQLVLEARSKNLNQTDLIGSVPKEIQDEDDVFLDKPKLASNNQNPNLNIIDQAIILALWYV
jgi:hypothetical protein